MTVHFVGAGPGDPELLTVRARDLIAASPLTLYAGSTIAPAILALCPAHARRIDTAPLDLDAIVALCAEADGAGADVVRLQSGDLAIHSAVAEQAARLEALGIAWTMVPGVAAFGAAAARLGRELTRPGVAQSVVVTRLGGRATAVPDGENLEAFARTGATLVLHLSVGRLDEIARRLGAVLGPDCPAALVERVGWPEERSWTATLGTLVATVGDGAPARLATILVGRALGPLDPASTSALYDAGYRRRFRS